MTVERIEELKGMFAAVDGVTYVYSRRGQACACLGLEADREVIAELEELAGRNCDYLVAEQEHDVTVVFDVG